MASSKLLVEVELISVMRAIDILCFSPKFDLVEVIETSLLWPNGLSAFQALITMIYCGGRRGFYEKVVTISLQVSKSVDRGSSPTVREGVVVGFRTPSLTVGLLPRGSHLAIADGTRVPIARCRLGSCPKEIGNVRKPPATARWY